MILAGVHADSESVVRFLAEAEAVARLQHPHIVQIHHIGRAGGLPFFELEYVEGGSLDRRLNGTPWPARRAADLVEALARGVAEAHRRRIIHRDLKPANILLEPDGTPKITDFGLAKSLNADSGLTRSDSILGTPGYMAPEQAAGTVRLVGPLADIYALGAILYELLTGRPPFRGATALETLAQVKTAEPVPPSRLVPGLSRDVETIALKCLQKEPGKRYATAAALAEDLRRFVGGEAIVARPVPSWERAWRWCRRNPVVASLAAAIAVILVMATAASLIAYENMRQSAQGEHTARLFANAEMKAAQDASAKEAAQRQRAEAALDEATAQRRLAEANFARARAAVDGYLTTVSESQLLKVPGLQPLRGELLESALRFYRDFLKERGDDPALQAEAAAIQLRIGRIQTEFGAADDARQTLQSAIATYQAAVTRKPEDLALRAALADAWQARGDVAANLGGPNAAQENLAACEKAVELREGLARSSPDDLNYQRDLAVAYSRLGLAQGGTGRDGIPADFRAADIRQALILKSPDDPKLYYGMGESCFHLATFLGVKGRHSDALAMCLRSQEYYRFAYGKLPNMIEYGCDLGLTYGQAADAYKHLGRNDEAIAEARKAVEHFQRMARDHPAVPVVKSRLRESWEGLAGILRDTGHPVEAVRTRRELGQWLDIHVEGPQSMFDGACGHARLSIPHGDGKSPPSTEEQAEARREADRAIEQLQRAIETGFADLNAIRTQKDLDPLRGRDDFKQLVRSLEERVWVRSQAAPVAAAGPVSRAERVFQARVDRAAGLHAVALIQRSRGHRDEARVALDEARVLGEQLLRERPGDVTLQVTLAATHRSLGSLDWEAGRLVEGVGHWDQSEDLMARVESGRAEDRRHTYAASTDRREIGDLYASYGLWSETAPFLARSQEPDLTANAYDWQRAAEVFLLTDDQAAYRALCARTRVRVERSTGGFNHPFHWAWTVLLAPGGIDEPKRALDVVLRHEDLEKDVRLNHVLALALYRTGRCDDAVRRLRGSEARDPNWRMTGLDDVLLALALHRLGRVDEARWALERAEATQAKWAREIFATGGFIGGMQSYPGRTWNNWALSLVLRREATAAIRGKVSREPPLFRLAVARLHARLGRIKEADADMEAAVAAAPDDAEVRLARGRLLAELGHPERAETDFARALSLNSTDLAPWIAHGRWLADRGARTEADRAVARAASLPGGELNSFIEAGWWVVGPYPEDLKLTCPPESDPDLARPAADGGSAGRLSWRPVSTGAQGRVDLRAVFHADHISAYASTHVDSPDERPATLMVAGDDRLRVWLNGRLVDEMDANGAWNLPPHPVPVHFQAGRNHLLVKVSNEGGAHSMRVRIAANPVDRATGLAALGLWNEAASSWNRDLPRRSPPDAEECRRWAAVLLLVGDSSGYRRLCAEVIQRFGRHAPLHVSWACAAGPDGLGDPRELEQLADGIRDAGGRAVWDFSIQGLARYRSGKYEQALELLRQAVTIDANWPPTWPILAMTHQRLGQTDEARRWLKKAEGSYDGACRAAVATGTFQLPWKVNWWELALFQVLLREARTRVNGPSAGGEPGFERLQARARQEWERRVRSNEAAGWLACGRRSAQMGRDIEASDEFARAIALAPLAPDDLRMAAAVHARLGRWDLAAETLARLVERTPDDHWHWCLAAVVSARAGDPDRYRRLCRRMLDRFGGTNDPEIAERTAKSSLLLPLSGPEQKEAGRLAERSVAAATGGVQPWALSAKGLAEYRLERFADALVTIQKSQATMGESAPWYFEVPPRCVRAMALLRMGQRDAAREALNKATALYRSNRPRTLPPEAGASWIDPLICEILLREAEALILYDAVFPANPFAP
jgi:serine/threonine-protein kinase